MAKAVSLDEYKAKVLEVLKYSISFFNRHGLNWFVACGSAIGAVRHKGFIPWDDDIDIYMPRSDYNKLFSLREELLTEGYRFLSIEDDGYTLTFGKIMDNRTTLWAEKRFPINFGVYIDIFPLDLVSFGMMSFGIKWSSYRTLIYQWRAKLAKVSFMDIVGDLKNGGTQNLMSLLAKVPLCFISKKNIRGKMRQMEESWNKPEGDRYVSFTEIGMYMFPREWFEEYILSPFEDIQVRIPKHYDEYLTYIYGDYMTPPPPNKRKVEGPHEKYYINIEQNVPLSMIK